ncbi:DDE-type integrase/transposase/recombinase [Herbinix luporum]|jgi:IS30 family transposase|nr:DDE-type integrase/transposase/recombinase [Herbinix luporum]
MKLNKRTVKPKSYPKSSYKKVTSTYPGERVQIDVKFVPVECIGFSSNQSRYYQITAIDEYSRKRYMELVNENSTFTTSNFLTRLEENLGFKVDLVQTDNGFEFVNDSERTSKKTRFQRVLKRLNIKHKRTRPYSPWQNGIVERSHRIDNERFYKKKRFISYREMEKSFYRYANRYNNIPKKILNFKTPNEIVSEFNFKDVS